MPELSCGPFFPIPENSYSRALAIYDGPEGKKRRVASIQTAVGYCCGLNFLQQVNSSWLNVHHEELFKFLSTLYGKNYGTNSAILFETRDFLFVTTEYIANQCLKEFQKSKNVSRLNTWPSATGDSTLVLFKITCTNS